jgi:hypothetical protein
MENPKQAAEELSVRLSIEIKELIEAYRAMPNPDLLERIDIKEQLLKELREFIARIKNGE